MKTRLVLTFALLTYFGCGKDSSSDDSSSSGALEIDDCENETDCGEKISTNLNAAAAAMNDVSTNYAPGTLQTDSTSLLSTPPNPSTCTSQSGIIGLPECQPDLLKYYTWLAAQPVAAAKETFSGTVETMKTAVKGKTGTVALSDGGELEYSATSTTNFEVLVKPANGNRLYLGVGGTSENPIYTLKARLANSSSGGHQYIHALINYAGDGTWTNAMRMIESKCSHPQIAITQSKSGTTFTGKAMIYQAKDTSKCTGVSSTGDAFWLTDYIGDPSFVTASMYWIPPTIDPKTASLSSYSFANLCTNISDHSICSSSPSISAFTNPYCIANNDSQITSSAYGSACTSSNNNDIVTAKYSEASNWLDPDSELRDLSTSSKDSVLCMPTSLDDKETCFEG